MERLTNKEEEIMQALWELQKGFVKDILALLPNESHYNTISTMVRNLEEKRLCGPSGFGKTHQYFPIVSKEEYAKGFMNFATKRFFDNSYKAWCPSLPRKKKISWGITGNFGHHWKKTVGMEFCSYLLKSAGVLTLFYGVYQLFLRKETFVTNRHFYYLESLHHCSCPCGIFTQSVTVQVEVLDALPFSENTTTAIPSELPIPSKLMCRNRFYTIPGWYIFIWNTAFINSPRDSRFFPCTLIEKISKPSGKWPPESPSQWKDRSFFLLPIFGLQSNTAFRRATNDFQARTGSYRTTPFHRRHRWKPACHFSMVQSHCLAL